MKVVFILAVVYLLVVAFLSRKKLGELHPKRFFLETWRELDHQVLRDRLLRESIAKERYLKEHPPSADGAEHPYKEGSDGAAKEPVIDWAKYWPYDWRPLVVLVSLAFVLTMHEYFGDRMMYSRLQSRGLTFDWGPIVNGVQAHSIKITGVWNFLNNERWGELFVLWFWAITRSMGYFIPILICVPLWKERYRDYGLNPKGFLEHAWIYALFFGIVLLCVIGVAHTGEFASYYPFYKGASRSWKDFFGWEIFYTGQFFFLEYYFRGFLVYAMARALGSGAIFAMVVPYCMIHFGKPMLETIGAIFAGTVLGTLSLKTRSIWSGFLIHVTVAISMDIAAMLMGPGLPGGIKLPASWAF